MQEKFPSGILVKRIPEHFSGIGPVCGITATNVYTIPFCCEVDCGVDWSTERIQCDGGWMIAGWMIAGKMIGWVKGWLER